MPPRRLTPARQRKVRLFLCACCRWNWTCLREDGRRLVEAAERYADGWAQLGEVRAARATVGAAPEERWRWEAAVTGWDELAACGPPDLHAGPPVASARQPR
jgi:hypothetical protein